MNKINKKINNNRIRIKEIYIINKNNRNTDRKRNKKIKYNKHKIIKE